MGVSRIAWAAPQDAAVLEPLMRALYAHDVPDAAAPNAETVRLHLECLLAAHTPHRLAIAWDEAGEALGLAAVGIVTSVSDPRPEHWRQCELKELFVLPRSRGLGIGHALLDWVEAQARAQGACRMDWHVKRDNARGIAFYKRAGGAVVQTRLSMRKTIPHAE